MANAIPIPIPLRGLNTISPDLPLEAGFARELTNYSIINGRLRMRPAVEDYADGSLETPSQAMAIWFSIGISTATSYLITSHGKVLRLSDDNVMATLTGTDLGKIVTRVKHVSLDLIIGVGEPREVDYPFTAWTFTTSVITAEDITSACSYKGRLYVCDSLTLEYSNVGQVTGAMYDSFSLEEFLDGQSVVRIFSSSIGSGNNSSENVFVIFGDAGKVLVYAGDYPASSTWNLIANFDMPRPLRASGFIEVDGDIWVSTESYAYWFSVLMGSGVQTARDNSPTVAIENLWQSQIGAFPIGNKYNRCDCVYIPNLDAICCNWNTFAPANSWAKLTSITYFFDTVQGIKLLYFRKYKAWALWLAPDINYPYRLENDFYLYGVSTPTQGSFSTNATYDIRFFNLGTQISVDDFNNNPITTSWKTPFINAFAGRVQRVIGVRPFFQSAVNGFLEKLRIIYDYSDYNSPYGFYTQPTVTQINPENYADAQIDVPTQQSDNYSPFVGLSGSGGGVSLQITQQRKTGSADNQLNEIYSATLYVEDGGDMI